MLHDIRIAFRSLRSHRAYAVISLLTIALVVGAGSAVLAVISATFIRPLPFADEGRLVWVHANPPNTGGVERQNPLHSTSFVRFRERLQQFEGVGGTWERERALDVGGEAEVVSAAGISANYFDVLGLHPAAGRMFTPDEDVADARVAVISHAFWQARLGGDPALGKKLVIDGAPFEVIGVMPPMSKVGFAAAEVYTPLAIHAGNMPVPASTIVAAIGRLKAGVSPARASDELAAVMRDVVREAPAMYTGWSAAAMPIRDALFGDSKDALLLLLAAVALLTLIACANLANVTIAEVMGRRDEVSLRTALGATRGAVIRVLATEHALVALMGGALGLVVSRAALPAVLALDSSTAAQLGDVTIDWRVQTGAVVLALAVSVIAGVVPAFAGTRGDMARDLAQAGRRTAGSRRQSRTRSWLVAAETLIASVLLTASALLLSAFDRTAAVKPGFDPSHVLAAQLRLPTGKYPTPAARTEFVNRMLAEIRPLPGVVDAAVAFNPFTGGGYQTSVHIDGRPAPGGQPHTVQFRRISPGYFRTMRIAELGGRTFTDADTADAQLALVVSRNFATAFWPDGDAIGKRVIRAADPSHPFTVIGVVADVSDAGLDLPPAPTVYVAFAQNSNAAAPVSVVVRTAGEPREFARTIAQAIHRVDATLPLSRVTTLDEFLRATLGPGRFRSVLLLVFAALGLVLAAVGIYGVTSRGVTERTRELGVRLALGSGRAELWRLVLRQAFSAVLVGLVAGLPAAFLASRALASWLPGVSISDGVAALPAVGMLALVGGLAAAIPAWRAARLDPIAALRGE